ncbi:integrase arm-type DNA-binding domain-containing protein [Vibrio diabolicus]|uniref:integrase arm-type DNA-binding domain-containing protein n=1 Tax=Vibrio diabolicus TaxID=50719 RepID=UPI00330E5000|nr:integrase family protein [Vibrio campbellii]
MSKNAQILHKFTRTFITNLSKQEPDGEQKIYKDTAHDANGLMLRVSPKGKLTYVVHGRIKAEGKSAQFFNIGNAEQMLLEVARKQAEKFKSWMAEGLHPIEAQNRQERTFTLQEFLESYLDTRGIKSSANPKGLQQDTIDEYRKQFARLNKKFQTRNALKITREDVKKEHNDVARRHTDFMSDKTFQLVGALYRHAIKMYRDDVGDEQIVKSNPVDVLTVTGGWKVNDGQSRRITDCIDTEHMPSVYQAIEDLKDYKDGIKYIHKQTPSVVVAAHFFRFMLFTGWRPEEVSKMTWSQVADDFRDVTWDDSEAAAGLKGAEEQYRAPLNSEATKTLQRLREYQFDSKWVFPNKTLSNHFKQNPTMYVQLLTELADTGKRYTAGIFRKTFQTYAEHINVNPVTIKRLVFHTQKHYNVQGGYIFANRENLRRQSQRVCDFILMHADQTDLAQSQQVQVDVSYVEAARAIVNDESSKYELVTEVLEHWLEIGMKFDQMSIK